MELIHGIDLIPCFFSPQDFTAFVFLNVIATLTTFVLTMFFSLVAERVCFKFVFWFPYKVVL